MRDRVNGVGESGKRRERKKKKGKVGRVMSKEGKWWGSFDFDFWREGGKRK